MNEYPDYTKYSNSELADEYKTIDKEKYPERVKLLVSEIRKRQSESSSAAGTNESSDAKCGYCGFVNEHMAKYCSECGNLIENYPKPAGFWIRVGARLIDNFIFLPLIILMFLNLFFWQDAAVAVVLFLPGALYKPLMESKFGATLGKMAVEIKVTDEAGNLINLNTSFIRSSPDIVAGLIGLIGTLLFLNSPDFEYAESLEEFLVLMERTSVEPWQTIVNLFVIIDALVVAFTHRKRAIHDFMAKTYCVYKQ
jgi:uncharacterized RDD family membrane protein YckC